MLRITNNISVPLNEIEISYVTAQGSGGQNVNKTATAAHLRFSITDSSLPEDVKQRLLNLSDQRITGDGTIVIKAQKHRTREQNRRSALHRLEELLRSAARPPKKRKATKPTASSRQKRLDEKNQRSRIKSLRRKIED